MSKVRIVLADDHPLIRNGLRGLVEAQPDLEIVGEAWNGEEAVRMALDLKPDLVVMDISMPGLRGDEATQQICSANPAINVLGLTAYEDRCYLQMLIGAGAKGYILKNAAVSDLLRAIRAVAAGHTYIDPTAVGGHSPSAKADHTEPITGLSEREEEVLRSIAQGHLLKQIATRLGVGIRTVETYKVRAMDKIGLKSRADVVRYAVRCGWLSAD